MMSHRPKKRFGQNFLVNQAIIEQIVYAINPKNSDHLVEIGPGFGAITLPLLPKVAKIDAIELDKDIIPLLEQKARDLGHLVVHQLDALNCNLQDLSSQRKSLRVIGNLPYNISTPLLFHLFNQQQYIIDMHFMMQKEVAERLAASPGNKQYGRLSVMAQYHCDIERVVSVPPTAFKPAPKVYSEFIRFTPQERSLKARDLKNLDTVVRQAFSQRRKTLHNALKSLFTREQFAAVEIDCNKRPEQLTPENFVILSNLLSTD